VSGPTREERVEKMVKDGWSREFAEAYIPMTLAEARRRNLEVRKYQSPITGLVHRRAK
jgi:hypothetical protein